MHSRSIARGGLAGLVAVLVAATPALAQDTRITVGSPASPFSRNKQNEPAVAIDQLHRNVLAAGANDNIDMEACNAGTDNTCPFTDGVGVSGISFSTNGGGTWTQPTYTGLSARNCTGAVGDTDPPCEPRTGSIGTLPNYDSNDLVSDGDPAVAFGPRYLGTAASRRRSRGSTTRTSPRRCPDTTPFKGFEAIAVSRTDDIAGAVAGDNGAWSDPVIASRQNGGLFADKEQIWADNAQSSPFYGNVYVCYAAFRGNGGQPLAAIVSRNGGATWTEHQLTPATNNTHSRNGFGRSGCTVRTDSQGAVYVFDFQFGFNATTAAAGQIQMIKSTDGGTHWSRPVNIIRAFDTCNAFEPSIGRCVEDGVGGARSDLSPAPSVDIANNAPTGAGATNRMVISWVDGRDGLNHEHVMISRSSNGGASWTAPAAIERAGRPRLLLRAGDLTGRPGCLGRLQRVHHALPQQRDRIGERPAARGRRAPRGLAGDHIHARFTAASRATRAARRRTTSPPSSSVTTSTPPRRTRTAPAVWNDVRGAADCDAVDRHRQALHQEAVDTGQQTAEPEEPRGAEDRDPDAITEDEGDAPDVQQECPANFGNSDIFGGAYADPTP